MIGEKNNEEVIKTKEHIEDHFFEKNVKIKKEKKFIMIKLNFKSISHTFEYINNYSKLKYDLILSISNLKEENIKIIEKI